MLRTLVRALHSSSRAMAVPEISVEIWSDIACPYCYIGKKRLDRAIAQLGDRAVCRPEWHAYLLEQDGGEDPGGLPHMEHYRSRFGSRAERIDEHIRKEGRGEGAPFAGWEWRGNTLAGHRLIALAGRHGLSHQASELLFQKAFERGANLSDASHLLEVADALSLPQDEAEAAATGPEGGSALGAELDAEVRGDDSFAKDRMQVPGVPFFLVGLAGSQERHSFSGAQPAGNWVQVFERCIRQAAEEEGAAAGGGAAAPR